MIYIVSHPSLPTSMLSDTLSSIGDYKCRSDKPLPSSSDCLIILFNSIQSTHPCEYWDLINGTPIGMRVILFGIINDVKELILVPKLDSVTSSYIEIVYGLPSHILSSLPSDTVTYLTQVSDSEEWRKDYSDFFEQW